MSRWPVPSVGSVVFTLAAPGMALLASPDVGFRDAGEVGGAAVVLGVAHPTGFSADMLLLHAAARGLPLGPMAFRQNVVTALVGAGVLALLAQLVATCVRSSRASRWPGALTAAAALSLWATFQQSALTVEVYSTALLALGLACAAVATSRDGAAAPLGTLCVWLGLAVGMHVLLAPLLGLVVLAALTQVAPGRRVQSLRARLPLVLVGAGLVAYLPLASRRDTAFDWGDPEALGRLIDHLTGARIRHAYSAAMLGGGEHASTSIAAQLGELWPVLPLALAGSVLLLRRMRGLALLVVGLLAADLAYAVWVNPMGIADRQVGHLAGACLCFLGGACITMLADAAPVRVGRPLGWGLAAAVALLCLARDTGEARADGFVPGELHGGGGVLSALPPRGLLVCWEDDQCAAALFARYAEGVRPDTDVVPAQHLWDPTVRRRTGMLAPRTYPAPDARGAASNEAVRTLAVPGPARPVLWGSADPLVRAGVDGAVASRWPPLLEVSPTSPAAPDMGPLERLEAQLAQGSPAPTSVRGRHAWAVAFGTLGEAWLRQGHPVAAARAFARATEVAPSNAVAWTNRGVALEAQGQLDQAVAATRRAIELAPERPTPWVNLVRVYLDRRGDAVAARRVLELARQAGVEDPRLAILAARLGEPAP